MVLEFLRVNIWNDVFILCTMVLTCETVILEQLFTKIAVVDQKPSLLLSQLSIVKEKKAIGYFNPRAIEKIGWSMDHYGIHVQFLQFW